MIRVSSVPTGMLYRSFSHSKKFPDIQRAFFSSLSDGQAFKPKKKKHYEIVRTEAYPAAQPVDLEKTSPAIRRIFEEAKELAKNQDFAMEGAPSDTLESLLAMRMRLHKT